MPKVNSTRLIAAEMASMIVFLRSTFEKLVCSSDIFDGKQQILSLVGVENSGTGNKLKKRAWDGLDMEPIRKRLGREPIKARYLHNWSLQIART